MKLFSYIYIALIASRLEHVLSLRGSQHAQRRLGKDAIVTGEVCASIIAIAGTRDPEHYARQRSLQTNVKEPDYSEEEDFVCEVSTTGEYLPLSGTDDQLMSLRQSLNNGELVSAETTIEGLTMSENIPADGGKATTEVIIPSGNIVLKQGTSARRKLANKDNRHRRLAIYEGIKEILVVRVTDSGGLVHPDSARVMSDKLFGTDGDPENMSTQFNACSFNKLTITNKYSRNIDQQLAAPGVIEVKIPISLTNSNRGPINSAAKSAAEDKLGFTLPGSFDHVMFVLEKCYVDCGWAAYAYVNSWNSVYQGSYYKFPGVQLHEIG